MGRPCLPRNERKQQRDNPGIHKPARRDRFRSTTQKILFKKLHLPESPGGIDPWDRRETELSVGIVEVKFWRELCKCLGRDDIILKQFAQGEEKEEVFKELQNEFLKKNQKEWMDIFKDLDVCVMPVNTFAEACEDPQIKARNMVVEIDHPKFGVIQNIASPIKYSRTSLEIKNLAPKIGQNTKEILRNLGYSEEDIRNFRKKGII